MVFISIWTLGEVTVLSYASYLLRLVRTELLFKNQNIFRLCSFYLQIMFKQWTKMDKNNIFCKYIFFASNTHYIELNQNLDFFFRKYLLKKHLTQQLKIFHHTFQVYGCIDSDSFTFSDPNSLFRPNRTNVMYHILCLTKWLMTWSGIHVHVHVMYLRSKPRKIYLHSIFLTLHVILILGVCQLWSQTLCTIWIDCCLSCDTRHSCCKIN